MRFLCLQQNDAGTSDFDAGSGGQADIVQLATEDTENTELLVLDRLTGDIIGCAIEVHRVLGPALLETIYEQALGIELRAHGIPFEQQVPVRVRYKDNLLKGQRLDLLVAGEVVVEIKSLQKLPSFAMAQVLSYLKATGLKRGLLLNFGKLKLTSGITRISL